MFLSIRLLHCPSNRRMQAQMKQHEEQQVPDESVASNLTGASTLSAPDSRLLSASVAMPEIFLSSASSSGLRESTAASVVRLVIIQNAMFLFFSSSGIRLPVALFLYLVASASIHAVIFGGGGLKQT